MQSIEAFEMGYRSAAAGFFFDSMEIVAALAPSMGGVEALRGAFELLFRERDRVNEDMAWLTQLCQSAYGTPIVTPQGVDDYRSLLVGRVFDIVNHWSYIDDIKQVNRLQAWFYAGFGLGRGDSVTRGLRMFERLHTIAGEREPLPAMPTQLHRMAAEAARQMDVASKEDDLRQVRPLFDEAAQRLQSLCLLLQRPHADVRWAEQHKDDLEHYADTVRKVRLDLAPPGFRA